MKHSPRSCKTPANLSDSVHRQLNSYALAAGAAGVSLLAVAQPSEAKIVYTPANVKIATYPQGIYNLDLNHDGKTDFYFQNILTSTTSGDFGRFLVAPENGSNGIVGKRPGKASWAVALERGARIGSKRHFLPYRVVMATSYGFWDGSGQSGSWINVTNRYLGLKFKIGGKTHYGWARLSVSVVNIQITATLTGYAYETIPNRPIIAGETKGPDDGSTVEQPRAAVLTPPVPELATLALLTQGASGLVAWRRRDSEEHIPATKSNTL